MAGETQFTFLHLLTRDVAYGQIPRANRADKHRSAAEWLESLPADRAEDRAEMIAHHYLAALELARSAGQETSELSERARRALAEAGERALTLNAFAQAIQFYTAAVGLTTTAGPERAHMLYRLMTAKMYGGGAEIKEFEEARDALLGCGQRELAAEVAVMAAVMQTNRGEQDVAWEQVGWAEKLIADATASRSKAFVLQWLALSYSLAGKPEEALEYGGAAIELAESLGLDDILANALSTRGITYLGLGDPRTLEDQRRSVEIARAANSVDVMRSLGNLASSLLDLGRIAEARETLEEAAAEAQRFGSMWYRDWLAPERVTYMYYDGAWDEALTQIAGLIADIEQGGLTSFMESANLSVRARIRLARGDAAGAVEDAERSLAIARIAKNPQLLHPALAGLAAVRAEIGNLEEASMLVDELFENWRVHPILASAFWLIEVAYALVPLGRGGELEEGLGRIKARSQWAEAAPAYVSGDFTTAADILTGMGSKPDEAYVRLRSGNDADVRRALEFYRSVGATRYLDEGESMLATSRSA